MAGHSDVLAQRANAATLEQPGPRSYIPSLFRPFRSRGGTHASIGSRGRVGPGFSYGAIAQSGERLPCTQEVAGSIPAGSIRGRPATCPLRPGDRAHDEDPPDPKLEFAPAPAGVRDARGLVGAVRHGLLRRSPAGIPGRGGAGGSRIRGFDHLGPPRALGRDRFRLGRRRRPRPGSRRCHPSGRDRVRARGRGDLRDQPVLLGHGRTRLPVLLGHPPGGG